MPAEAQLSLVLGFGNYEIDVRAGELRKSGVKLKLQEQPFQVLCMLVERPGEIVTREELRNRLWPADTFVDFDHGLNAAVKRLRDTLGESADTPVYIETLSRRGYRFIAPVVRSPEITETPVPVVDHQESAKSNFHRRWVAVALLVPILITSVAWALWRYPSRHTERIERRLTANSSENPVVSAAISPDGRFLVYSDSTGLYQKLIRTGETHPVPLPHNFSALVDDWFPDGAHVLVTRVEGPAKPSLWSVPVFGGSPRKLTDDGSKASVSPDGAHIALLRSVSSDEQDLSELWVMRSDGTDPDRVVAAIPQVGNSQQEVLKMFAWSPNGKQIAYIRTKWRYFDKSSSLELTEWQSARTQVIFSDVRLGSALHWLPDGRLLYVLEEDTSPLSESSAWAVTLRSAKINSIPTRITKGFGKISTITASADGKFLAFVRESWQNHVFVGTLSADGKQLVSNRRLTLEDSTDFPFSWTPDSKAVLFNSDRNGTLGIFKQGIDAPLAESLVASSDLLTLPRLSPDGSEVLYISNPKSVGPDNLAGISSVFAVPIGGGTPRFLFKDAGICNVQCARLPSTLCLYTSFQGKRMRIIRFNVKTGQPTGASQLEPSGQSGLSPDDSEIAIAVYNPDAGKIELRSTSTGETREIHVSGWRGFVSIDWSADGKSLHVLSLNHAGETTLLNVLRDGSASVLLSGSNPRIGYAIPSPDGHFLAMPEQTGTSNVWLVDNSGSDD